MAAIHWLNPLDGNFTNPADWSGGAAPGASDSAILDAVGSSFTVSSAVNETVRSIQLASNATLAITGGTFDALAGTGSGSNAGVILVGAGDTLSLGGMITNSGAITLDSPKTSNNYAYLTLAANATLKGDGVINDAGSINAETGGSTITNLNNTIIANFGTSNGIDALFEDSPAGTTFINGAKGVIDCYADLGIGGAQALSIVNNGAIESTDFGSIGISNTNISGSGLIAVDGAGSVAIGGVGTVSGQRFSVAAGGHLYLEAGAVDYAGTFENAGTVAIAGTLATSGLFLTGNTSLSGGGTVDLGNGVVGNIGGSAGDDFINVDNTITGFGNIGDGRIGITNQAKGVIVCNSGQLVIQGRHGATITNAGLIEAVDRFGVLTIGNLVSNSGTIASVGGQLTIYGDLINNGLVSVGGIAGRGGGDGILTIDGTVTGAGSVVISNAGTLNIDAGFEQAVTFTGDGFLRFAHSQAYQGTISGFSSTGETALDLEDIKFVSSSEATFSGAASGGILTVKAGHSVAHINLAGDFQSSAFVTVNDGHGGVIVVATTAQAATAPHAMISAMATLGAGKGAGDSLPTGSAASRSCPSILALPRFAAL